MAANHMRAWAQLDTGHLSSRASSAVLRQLMGWAFVALCGMVFFMVAFPSYGEVHIGGSPNVAPSRLMKFTILGLMSMVMLIKPFRMSLTQQSEPWAKAIYYIVVAFWLWTLPLVLFNAKSFGYTFSSLKNSVIPIWMSFWLTVALVKREDQVQWLIRMLGMATVVVLGVLAIEVVLKRNVFDGLLQLDNSLTSDLAFNDETRDGQYRAKATFQHPLVLAHYLVAMGLLFVSKGIFHPRPLWDGVPWWGLGLVALGSVYFTHTRSGLAMAVLFLSVLLCIRYVTWLRTLRNRVAATLLTLQLLWVPFFFAGFYYFAADLFMGRTAVERGSTAGRIVAIFNALEGVSESPLIGFGIGLGHVRGGVSIGFSMDNLFLLQALDNGLPAMLLLLALFLVSAWRLLPRWSELRSGSDIGLRVGLVMLFYSTIAMYAIYALEDLFEFCFVMIGATLCIQGRFANKFVPARNESIK